MGIQDTFQLYGTGFQNKLLAVLMKDRVYLQQIHDIIEPSYFSSESSQWIAKAIVDYYSQYKSTPTLEVMKVEIDGIQQDVLKTTVIDTLKDIVRNIDAPDHSYTKDKSLDFCKNQKLKAAILESVQLLQQGKYEAIKTTVDEAMKAGSDKDIGHEYITELANIPVGKTKKTMLEAVVAKVYEEALNGNMTAVAYLSDRILGKPNQSIGIKDTTDEPIKVFDLDEV